MSSGWEWRRSGDHESQPLLEWWLEQVAVVIVVRVGKRAFRRGDTNTGNRMLAISRAGADSEQKEWRP